MIKDKKKFLFIILFLSIILFPSKSYSNEKTKFLSLRNSEVNLRQGPSFKYPIKLIYKKKYLPVVILDKVETWRKIIDFQNNSGWIHISQLSKKKSAINKKDNSVLFQKPKIYSKPIAKLETGRLVLIKKCNKKWCKVTSGKVNGWIKKTYLWGKIN